MLIATVSRTVQMCSRLCLRPAASAPTTITRGKAKISMRGFGGVFAEVSASNPTHTVHTQRVERHAERQCQSS